VKALKRDEQNSARLTHAANQSIRVGGLSSVLILHMHYFIRAHGWYTEPFIDIPKDFWHAGRVDKRKRLDRLMIGYFIFSSSYSSLYLFFGGGDNGLVTLTARQRFRVDQPTCNLGVHARGSCRLGLTANHASTVGHGKRRKSKMRQGRRYFTNAWSIGMTAWLEN